jgi:peptidoglycan hydrolase-like protein with peptidoglycan-binding domain
MEQQAPTTPERPRRPALRPTLVAAAVAVVLAVTGTAIATTRMRNSPDSTPVAAGSPAPTSSTVPEATTTTGAPTTTSAPTTTVTPTTRPKPKPKPKPKAARKLRLGDEGEDVKALQEELLDLGYFDLTEATGKFDAGTRSAVMAFQKLNGLDRDGIVGAESHKAFAASLAKKDKGDRTRPLAAHKEGGFHVETDLSRQLTFLVDNAKVVGIVNISSASGRTYVSEGQVRLAHTPSGTFSIERRINGWRKSKLGLLYRPAYFVGGYAYHGSYSVPGYPASHGCIRMAISTMDRVYDKLKPGTRVYIYRT